MFDDSKYLQAAEIEAPTLEYVQGRAAGIAAAIAAVERFRDEFAAREEHEEKRLLIVTLARLRRLAANEGSDHAS